MKNITGMDWGAITPEFFNGQKNSAVHIFNHSLIGEENVDRSIKFALGRIEWYKEFLPEGCKHEVVFDDRGQSVDDIARSKIIKALKDVAFYVKFMSKER